ncbi:hypothetical protein FJ986_25400 [Mesorhizobium sp. B1-1-1]|uniref:hypothetical protein n=1 Tax=Mesorhizobium sp. B1-1-1 TaxID=2589983 RepID=UPI0011287A69|nr:hypothetical protein [Mesorhizobium sp. B1-1-1]TPN62577.1 hypothetical protein FJ986_25400 [Mesorhizobium sp. B1-1-1]
MRDAIIADLSTKVPTSLATELVETYEQLVAKHRGGDLEAALTKAGRFVEHTFRLIEHIRTGTAPAEIKQVGATIRAIENDTTLPDPLRILIPRAAYGMIYDLRSKRNAVHVKETDPTAIDVSLTVAAAGWITAELLRLYHKSDEKSVADAMLALTRGTIPMVESINGEVFVGRAVPAKFEMLLLLAHAKPKGMNRTALGNAAKCSQPSVSTALKALGSDRMVHLGADQAYYITSNGEQTLGQWLISGGR